MGNKELNHWQWIIFWYANIISFGFIFFMAWVFDNITPRELIKYVNSPTP